MPIRITVDVFLKVLLKLTSIRHTSVPFLKEMELKLQRTQESVQMDIKD